jgi:hypothetical protein
MGTIILDLLNKYSSLALVIVTTVYVVVTWLMVREMREAREMDTDPYLIATIVPISPVHVKLQILNAGRGPAFSVIANVFFDPLENSKTQVWRTPILLPGIQEYFRLPDDEGQLSILSVKYQNLVVEVSWKNSFRKPRKERYVINLKELEDGWFQAKWQIHQPDISSRLGLIKDEIEKLNNYLSNKKTS